MPSFTRITHDPNVMGGKPCIRGLRVTVGTVVGLVTAGQSEDEILRLYPYLAAEDIHEALAYAACQFEERETSLPVAIDPPDFLHNKLRREAVLGSRAAFERVLAKVPDVPPEPFDALD